MKRTFDGLTLDEIIEIQKNINKQCKYYKLHEYLEVELMAHYFDRALIDFTNNSFVTTCFGEQYQDLKFEDYRKTWSDKREDLEENEESK